MREMDSRLAAVLPAGSLFAVGGRVRDELRQLVEGVHIEHKDLDYVVTGISLADLQRLLTPIGRVDLVGASFAVIKFTAGGITADVALPRRERSVGVGHRDFEVESGAEIALEDDLGRRDFRMNMLARALPGGELVDPFGGEADIRARRVDLLTPKAFEEDPLRLLRAAQFAARFGYQVTELTRTEMAAAAPLVKTVSAERVADELSKLLERAPKPSVGLELLRETGVLACLWPELIEGVGVDQNEWHAHDVYRHTLATVDATPPGDLVLRLAALLHDVGKPRTKDGPHFYRHEHVGHDLVREMLGRFRFSNEIVDSVAHLVRQHMYNSDADMTDAAIRRFIRRVGLEHLERQFALRNADVVGSGLPKRGDHNERFAERVRAEIERQPAFSLKDLQLTGADVVQAMIASGAAPAGFRGDARVGTALEWLFEQVTDQPDLNEPNTLRGLLSQFLSSGAAAQGSNVQRET
ncbi:MAG: HD domain-containing protein [Candidatus Eremiobacteraeota bacterium]|nr:HD domain-containing protein [Candidatus Eremiobacteraeota bacterium]